jgi:hypothetical protein
MVKCARSCGGLNNPLNLIIVFGFNFKKNPGEGEFRNEISGLKSRNFSSNFESPPESILKFLLK